MRYSGYKCDGADCNRNVVAPYFESHGWLKVGGRHFCPECRHIEPLPMLEDKVRHLEEAAIAALRREAQESLDKEKRLLKLERSAR